MCECVHMKTVDFFYGDQSACKNDDQKKTPPNLGSIFLPYCYCISIQFNEDAIKESFRAFFGGFYTHSQELACMCSITKESSVLNCELRLLNVIWWPVFCPNAIFVDEECYDINQSTLSFRSFPSVVFDMAPVLWYSSDHSYSHVSSF